jgi:hypothetical protein
LDKEGQLAKRMSVLGVRAADIEEKAGITKSLLPCLSWELSFNGQHAN